MWWRHLHLSHVWNQFLPLLLCVIDPSPPRNQIYSTIPASPSQSRLPYYQMNQLPPKEHVEAEPGFILKLLRRMVTSNHRRHASSARGSPTVHEIPGTSSGVSEFPSTCSLYEGNADVTVVGGDQNENTPEAKSYSGIMTRSVEGSPGVVESRASGIV